MSLGLQNRHIQNDFAKRFRDQNLEGSSSAFGTYSHLQFSGGTNKPFCELECIRKQTRGSLKTLWRVLNSVAKKTSKHSKLEFLFILHKVN